MGKQFEKFCERAKFFSNLRQKMWNPSYSPDYFSLHDILAEQERIPVVTNEDLPKLGFLDLSTSSKNGTLMKGTKLELPLWMAKTLKSKNRATLSMPPSFTDRKRQIVHADADAVNYINLDQITTNLGD